MSDLSEPQMGEMIFKESEIKDEKAKKDSEEMLDAFTPMELIRTLSGLFKQEEEAMVYHLALINIICRAIEGDTTKEFANKILGENGIRIKWG